jgi:ketosteroid isomerase-like protein
MTSANKTTVHKYMDAFNRLDHAEILACLTDDVEWVLPGVYHHYGKEAFDREIENENFTGRPLITTTRVTEENDVVIAEGTVRAQPRNGDALELVYCDVFEMRGGLVRKLTSYLMPLHPAKQATPP